MAFGKFLGDLYKGPDGETWAIGRIYSIPVLITGIYVIVDTHLNNRALPSMTDLGIGLAGVAASATALISGTKNVDTPGSVGLIQRLLPAPPSALVRP